MCGVTSDKNNFYDDRMKEFICVWSFYLFWEFQEFNHRLYLNMEDMTPPPKWGQADQVDQNLHQKCFMQRFGTRPSSVLDSVQELFHKSAKLKRSKYMSNKCVHFFW